jgi:hypothetical protein
MSNLSADSTRNWGRWALIGLIALGLGLRVWGISFGLPYLYHPDEPVGAGVAINMVRTGDLNPHSFGYGSLFFYLNALAYGLYFVLGRLVGLFQTPTDLPQLQHLGFDRK